MKSFFNPAAKPSIGWPRNLSRSAALIVLLMLVAAPWHRAAAAADNPNDIETHCGGSVCTAPDGVTFSVEQSNGREGDATLDFTVTVHNPHSESMTVGWRTRDGSTIPGSPGWAYEGEDFTASSGSLSIAPGRSSHTVSIPIIDDSIVERDDERDDERFRLILDVGPRGPDLDYNDRYIRYFTFTGRIYDDDVPVVPVDTSRDFRAFCLHGTCETRDGVNFSVPQSKGREGTDATLDITVTVDNPRSESMTVGWQTNDYWSNATAGEDFTSSSGSLSIAPGRSSHTISIPIIDDDSTPEVVESVALELDLGPRGADLHRRQEHLRYLMFFGRILPKDDTTAPTVTVTHDPLTPAGGQRGTTTTPTPWNHVRINVEFSEPVAGFDKSDLEFENGKVVNITANDGSYQTSWVVHIVPAEGWYGTMSIRVPAGVATDSAGLSNTASNTVELRAWGTPPTDVAEPDREGEDVVLRCFYPSDPAVWDNWPHSLGRNRVAVKVLYSANTFQDFAAGLTGTTVGEDGRPYFNLSGAMSLTNEDGVQAGRGLSVSAGGGLTDSIRNWSTTIAQGMTGQLTLQVLPGSLQLWDGSAPMAIAGRGWSVAAADASATAGTDATIDFEVRLNARDDCKAVKVDYATADGTATAGEDYTAASGTLTFEPGENVKTISIPVLEGGGSDGDETFELRLSNALGVQIRTGEATGTIMNEAAAPLTARFDNLSGPNDGSTPFSFELHFSEHPEGLSYKTVRDALFDVIGGAVTGAKRLAKGSNQGWAVTVQPDRAGEVAITVRGTESCEDEHAVCTENGDMLAGGERLVVTSSQSLVVRATADAVLEGQDATIEFLVRMSHAVADEVRVRYGADSDSRLDDDASMATPGEDYKAVSGTIVFAPGEMQKTVSVSVLDDEFVEGDESVRLAFSDANRPSSTSSRSTGRFANFRATATIMDDESAVESLTASFAKMPDSHDGSGAFEFEIHFSEEPHDLSYKTVRDALFDVANGTVTKARRLTRGSNLAFVVTVEPTAQDAIEISVRGTESCDAEHAVCAADGRTLSAGPSVTVQYADPITLSVADAEVEEGPGATLDFVMSLSRAADDDITVYYKAYDGTATAGADYEAVRSSIVFSPGQTEKTVSVVVLDDALDEGAETVNFWITAVSGLPVEQVVDPYATGTIRNTDKMPAAWIARFGRTVAEHVLDAVEARREAAPTPGMEASLAGQRIGGAALPEDDVGQQGMHRSSLSDWLTGETDAQQQNLGSRTITERDLLTGSSFALTAQTKGSGLISMWGRGAVTRFSGRDGDLAVDGEVASGMLGADWTQGAWKTGLLVSHSLGDGGYRGASVGTVTSTLTGIFPWARHALSERISAWGVAGYGEGSLTLEPEEQPKIRTDLDLWMAAAGLRSVLVDGGQDGPTLAAKTDAMIVRTSSDAVSGGIGNLAAAEAEVTRLRLGLEGSQPLTLAEGATLTPSVEIGVRHDGGDAETGFGVDIGGGLAWSDTIRGITAEFRGRGLLTHEANGFRDRALSGSLSWDPTPVSDRGPRASLTQTLGGSASGGMNALLSRETLTGLAANDNGDDLQQQRLEARFGYGFAAFGDRFTSSPEFAVGLSNVGRDYSLGWRLVRGGGGFSGGSLELSVEALRREAANDEGGPEHQVGFRVNARF